MHMIILLYSVCCLLEEILATCYMKLSGATVIYISSIKNIHFPISERACPAPSQNANTTCSYITGEFVINDILNCTCDEGFLRISGDYSRMCLWDTKWSGSQLKCSGTISLVS